jgi:general secretion pathway protein C
MSKMPIAQSNKVQTAIAFIATLAALTLMALVLAYWTWAWLGPRTEPRAEPLGEPVGRLSSVGSIVGTAQASLAAAVPAALPLKLIGVVAASGREPGYALVQVDAKKVFTVRAGDEISPGVRLEKVFPDRVTLKRTGSTEELTLAERRKPSPVIVPAARK